ncbi:hypothetical protein M3J09_008213 [Ascochyta lentis]
MVGLRAAYCIERTVFVRQQCTVCLHQHHDANRQPSLRCITKVDSTCSRGC